MEHSKGMSVCVFMSILLGDQIKKLNIQLIQVPAKQTINTERKEMMKVIILEISQN